jgi:ubiquinone biosynthesis monooxygenase Coq7
MTGTPDGSGMRPRATAADALPGDPDREELVARMIRVDQAGEYGAVRIYEGQLAVLRGTPAGDEIEAMIVARRVRPTALQPLWHLAGFALGAATAALGPRAAMACTVAVEEVIGKHYGDQANRLGADEAPLREKIEAFRDDELKHLDTAVEHGAYETPGYELLAGAVKAGSRLAIWLSTRL